MGSKVYQVGAHVVFKLAVHLVFVTKYRRKAITARVWEVMLATFREVCDRFGCLGGCAWLQIDRCSGCRFAREEVPSQRLRPGAVTPAAAAAAVALAELEARKRRGRR